MCCLAMLQRREDKDILQQALSAIPSNECYVVLGDFNAHVGSRVVDDLWWYERGPHGYGEANEAGVELLSFLSINDAIRGSGREISASRPGNIQSPRDGTALTM